MTLSSLNAYHSIILFPLNTLHVTCRKIGTFSLEGIRELYPQYSAEIGWFDKTSYIHPYNMMITRRDFFDRYMSSLFPLLFWIEKKAVPH